MGNTEQPIKETPEEILSRVKDEVAKESGFISWNHIKPHDEWMYLDHVARGCMKEAIKAEAGWISVEDKLPEKAGWFLVAVNTLQPHTDEYLNDVYKIEVKIIYYFKERNVTGWEKDWTGKPSDVKFYMPIPKPPNE